MRLFIIFLLFNYTLNGQALQTNTFPPNGNVGIGTLTPSEKLDVLGKVKGYHGIFKKSLPNGMTFSDTSDRNIQCSVLNVGTQLSPSGYILNVLDFPESNLNSQAQSLIDMEDRNYKSRWRFYANTGGSSELLYYNKNQSVFFSLNEDGADNVQLSLPKSNSYLTIGTNTYDDNGELYKLSVNGAVRAHRVKVYTDWADFVFEDSYTLPSLEEVEKHIQERGHLKDIPSAEEVKENGIDLGEMNKLLLQKIEELTLYLIEKDKQYKILEKEVTTLKKQYKENKL